MDAVNLQKREMRNEFKSRRAAREYDPEVAGALCIQMAELVLRNGASKIACYLAYGDEPDTELFIDWALENEIEVVLPISNQDGTLTWLLFDGQTEPGIFGFPEPVGATCSLADVDLIFVPALAVDKSGERLGKGKGYYDRALAALETVAPVVAIVFDEEFVESIPSEDHDHPVDAVVTPSRTSLISDRLN
jgi:5-formyltetrahydrofolate cyclo-ligase